MKEYGVLPVYYTVCPAPPSLASSSPSSVPGSPWPQFLNHCLPLLSKLWKLDLRVYIEIAGSTFLNTSLIFQFYKGSLMVLIQISLRFHRHLNFKISKGVDITWVFKNWFLAICSSWGLLYTDLDPVALLDTSAPYKYLTLAIKLPTFWGGQIWPSTAGF